MGDYTGMSGYYDLIMTSGYYDYGAIVDRLVEAGCLTAQGPARSVLEIGAGTGLVLERLAAHRPDLDLTGIDLTQAMLDIAIDRLRPHPRVDLHRQDVATLSLGRRFDVAFSYGGVWYFVPDSTGFAMISHIRDDERNRQGLERVAAHLVVGGSLLLGVQAPHHDYERPVTGGLVYSQRITALPGGFRKDYRLDDHGRTVMQQTTDYRVYPPDEATELLGKCGFEPPAARPQAVADGDRSPLFLEFVTR